MKKINITIVDDHNLFRKGLIKLISLGDSSNKYAILFEAGNGQDLKEKLERLSLPDIIIMDINMPDMDGYETVAWLRDNHPGIKILVVSMIETEEGVIKMLRLGVKGYLSKDIEVEDMHRALEAISNNGFYYSELVSGIMAQVIMNDGNQTASRTSSFSKKYSDKELQFIKLACTEMTYAEIADKMNLSPKTIEGYRDSLFKKLNLKSRVGLTMYAIKNGIVTP